MREANTKNVNEQRSLKRKYISKKRQTEESVSKQNNSIMSNPDTLPVNNRFSILSMGNLMRMKAIKLKLAISKQIMT